MRRMHRYGVVALAGSLALVGCSSPFGKEDPEAILRRRVATAIDRELAALPPNPELLETTPPQGEVEKSLLGRRDELEAIGPQIPFPLGKLDLGPDLTGRPQEQVALSLQSAIVSAVRNNLTIQIASLQPAISEADVVAAEAVFDALFFAGASFDSTDQPQSVLVLDDPLTGLPTFLGTRVRVNDRYRFETGLRKRLTLGGELSITTDLERFNDKTPGLTILPDPAYTAAIRLGLTQPLLRGFGSKVNTASIRLTRNMERRSIQQLESELLQLVNGVESGYWDLVFAWDNLEILEWLLEVGIQVRDVMERRRDFDTKPAEFSDAVARVESRKALVIEARREIRRASDELKRLINDPYLTVGSEALLFPADLMVEEPIRYNLREAIMTAVGNRPEVQQAILDIDDASIRQMLADNARLPLLNLSAQMAYFGLDTDAGDAYDNLFEGSFVDYLVGLNLEWPIGNRAAEAGYRQARLQRSVRVIAYQRAIQDVVLDVKGALRDCLTSYELIQANRSNRIAQAENLRTLQVEEETLAGLTPEFLNLKFQRQERLADAEREEVRSLVAYNKAVAGLYRAMGVGLAMNQIELEITGDE